MYIAFEEVTKRRQSSSLVTLYFLHGFLIFNRVKWHIFIYKRITYI